MSTAHATMTAVATLPIEQSGGRIHIICAVCRTGFPPMSPHPFPVCPDCLKQLRNMVEDSKSNWVANSKGGEPNHR